MSVIKFARTPDRVHTKEELIGVISQTDFQNIVVLIEDNEGCIETMTISGTTAERMNWMLDRAKVLLHRSG